VTIIRVWRSVSDANISRKYSFISCILASGILRTYLSFRYPDLYWTESQHKWCKIFSVRSGVVAENFTRPDYWLLLVVCIPISHLWQERHQAHKKSIPEQMREKGPMANQLNHVHLKKTLNGSSSSSSILTLSTYLISDCQITRHVNVQC